MVRSRWILMVRNSWSWLTLTWRHTAGGRGIFLAKSGWPSYRRPDAFFRYCIVGVAACSSEVGLVPADEHDVSHAAHEVDSIAVAFHHACAAFSNGTVRCWGGND